MLVLQRTRTELRSCVGKDEMDEQKGKWQKEAEGVKKDMEQMRADLCKAIVERDEARSERDSVKVAQDLLKIQLQEAKVEAEAMKLQRDKAREKGEREKSDRDKSDREKGDRADKRGKKERAGSPPPTPPPEEATVPDALKAMLEDLDETIHSFSALPQAERKTELRKLRGLYHPDAQKVKTPAMQKFFTQLSQHVNRYCELHLKQDCPTCKT